MMACFKDATNNSLGDHAWPLHHSNQPWHRIFDHADWPARATPGDYNKLLEAQLPLTRAEWIEVLSNRASVFRTDQSAISAPRLAR